MRPGLLSVLFVSAIAFVVVGCSPASTDIDRQPPAEDPASDSRLAPGLYDQADGTAVAIGTLEWIDLEGGFWAVVGGTEAEGDAGTISAVIANGGDFQKELEPLAGKTVTVTGTKLNGLSIRMAGPEIEMDSVVEMTDTPGIAE